MFKTILVPLDGSDLAERALPYAKTLARAGGGKVVLVRAEAAPVGREIEVGGERMWIGTGDEDYLAGAKLSLQGPPVETTLVDGHPGDAILEAVREHGGDSIVMTTHGRSGLGRWLYGSVADHVLRHAEVPILLVPAACTYAWNGGQSGEAGQAGTVDAPRRILVPLDGSEFAETILPAACRLARLLDAAVDVVRVIELPTLTDGAYGEPTIYLPEVVEAEQTEARRYVEEIAAGLKHDVRAVTGQIEVGWATMMVEQVARERHSCAIAMATHGRSGLARVVLGSVATATVQRSCAPLLLMRPTGLRATAAPAMAAPAMAAPGQEQVAAGV